MHSQYARHIRNRTIAGSLLGAGYLGGSVAADTAFKNSGRKEKDKKSVLKRGAIAALGGAALGGVAGRYLGKAEVRRHKSYEDMNDAFRRAHHERAHRASGGSGDWNYHTYSKVHSHAPSDQHMKFHGLSGKETTKKEVTDKYRSLAKQYHPDMHGGNDQKMKDLNAAHDAVKKTEWFNKLGFATGFRRLFSV